ncbi:hypothetical protein MKZ38_007039 [Zalerion maritima]|uniref:DSC E3 ubiquitin ligase complex subunit A n=1 Tax=Zalerion maritima TaxID=339359 RepID=A0AAD5WWM3_9PEZI|nr:hypothetical protein MKZ38_007039 [Zalerion maritima]
MPQQQPAPNAQGRAFLFYLIVIFWLLTGPDSSGYVTDPDAHASRRERQDTALGILNSSSWGDFTPRLEGAGNTTSRKYLNITGFHEEDGFAWEDLKRFRDRCQLLSDNAKLVREGEDPGKIAVEPIWQNASGIVRGPWERRDVSAIRFPSDYNLTAIGPGVRWVGGPRREWSRNMTGSQGSLMVKLTDSGPKKEIDLVSPDGEIVPGGKARKIGAMLSLEDSEGSGTTHDIRLQGVHWVREGTILMTTTSPKFAGIFGLPHLAPSAGFFEPAKRLLNQTLWEAVEEHVKDTGDPFLSEYASSAEEDDDSWTALPSCEYIVYLQIHSVRPNTLGVLEVTPGSKGVAAVIEDIEGELEDPTGAPLPRIPPFQISGVMYSPDCATMMETKGPPKSTMSHHLLGFKEPMMYFYINIWFYGIALVLTGQLYLLKKQIQQSFTPSTLGRISFASLLIMGTVDGMTFTSMTALTLSSSRTFLACLATVFPCLVLALMESNFLSDIYKTQEPERRRRFQEQHANDPAPSTDPAPANQASRDTLPLPATTPGPRTPARPPSPPIIVPSDQDVGAAIEENTTNRRANTPARGSTPSNNNAPEYIDTPYSTILSRCILSGTAVIFLSIAASSWWKSVRTAYANLVLFAYLSFWVPQIHRNVMRNCRRALSWRFTIGQSVLRLLPIAYFYLHPTNIILCATDPTSFAVLAGWVWIQLWILGFQDVLGPRFGIPKSWTPEAWDYHPILREDNAESGGLPVGLVDAPGSPGLERVRSGDDKDKDKDKGRQQKTRITAIDCAICCEDIEVPIVKAGEEEDTGLSGVAGVLARRQYMVTPCRHIFHSQCLEGWMRFRLQCPICREELPPM